MKFMIITHWERDYEARDKNNFKLVAVVEKITTTANLLLDNDDDDCEIVSTLEDGKNNKGLIVAKDRLPLKRSFHSFYIVALSFLPPLVLLLGASWIVSLLIRKLKCG
ncbi:unnamed protein product [Linum trigynum]|uniref:Uncharacterized protein n=1 Tax=Linum trigynum TaxID=586398 RepID=A0AAV2EZT0_9ROSI